jgi:ribosomal protein S18 acetylase RimI-like enzyme
MNIREAEDRDVSEIIRMMRDFARFEELEEYFEATEGELRDALFGPEAFVEAFVAEEGGRYAGYALFYPNYASFRGQKGYYLEDLYVASEFRGSGLGETFLRQIARRGAASGFSRIDFQVLEWNAPAIGFYEKLGAHRDDTERHFKFTDEAFLLLAEQELRL